MIKGMLSVNGKISRDLSRADTTWLRRPELNVEGVTWQHVTKKAVKQKEVMWGQKAGGWRKMLLIERSSKSKRRYRLVVRLKAIEYKENFLCYLSSTASLSHSPWMRTNPLRHFPRPPVIRSTYDRAHSCDDYLIGSSSRVRTSSHTGPSSG